MSLGPLDRKLFSVGMVCRESLELLWPSIWLDELGYSIEFTGELGSWGFACTGAKNTLRRVARTTVWLWLSKVKAKGPEDGIMALLWPYTPHQQSLSLQVPREMPAAGSGGEPKRTCLLAQATVLARGVRAYSTLLSPLLDYGGPQHFRKNTIIFQ